MEKLALITGASKGIGKALAYEFAKHGFSLLLVARNTKELQQLQAELKTQYTCDSKILSLDLSTEDSVEKLLETFKEDLPKLDILINNAGFGIAKKFTDMASQDVHDLLMLNINNLTELCYRLLPFMQARKNGKILNVASTAAYTPGPYMAMYYASKAYVLSFSRALYEEYKAEGITVATLCPGVTPTHFGERAGTNRTRLTKGSMPVMSAEKVAKIAYRDLMRDKAIIITGFMNKMLVFLMRLLPNGVLVKITAPLNKTN
jgi:hypothetical protein